MMKSDRIGKRSPKNASVCKCHALRSPMFLRALLVVQLSWSPIQRFLSRPRPGVVGVESFLPGDGLAERYVIYLPKAYASAKSKQPLVVFLHGSGERGNNPEMLRHKGPLTDIEMNGEVQAIIALPQCLPNSIWQPEGVAACVHHVAANHQVDETRIYLIGYSMGGNGAWSTATDYPGLLAAIVPICGRSQVSDAATLIDIPVSAQHIVNVIRLRWRAIAQ